MGQDDSVNAIPKDTAVQLCSEIRLRNRSKWYTPNGIMCRFCSFFAKDDVEKMCISNAPDYRGCYQVNARYDRQMRLAG